MSIFVLSETISFPSPRYAEPDGLLAVGGDLDPKRIIKAYSMGIFPWYSKDSPILWWSPDPRLILFPDELIISRSLRQLIRKGLFTITINHAFRDVIRSCADIRRSGQSGTWLTEEMILAYSKLHEDGYAYSVEAWMDGELVGGLYGIILGKVFFGESMFSIRNNASKVALAVFVEKLNQQGFRIIDCQVKTEHLISLGAREIPRREFLKILKTAI